MKAAAYLALTAAMLLLAPDTKATEPGSAPAAAPAVDPARLESARRLVSIILPPERLQTELDLLIQDITPIIEAKKAQHHGS